MYHSSHARSIKRQPTVRFTGHSRTVSLQHGTYLMPLFWRNVFSPKTKTNKKSVPLVYEPATDSDIVLRPVILHDEVYVETNQITGSQRHWLHRTDRHQDEITHMSLTQTPNGQFTRSEYANSLLNINFCTLNQS
jgi:hypothetical protein